MSDDYHPSDVFTTRMDTNTEEEPGRLDENIDDVFTRVELSVPATRSPQASGNVKQVVSQPNSRLGENDGQRFGAGTGDDDMDIDPGKTNTSSASAKGFTESVTIAEPDPKTDLDLLKSIKGMYRFFDLVTEQGSGGLVDKVIIDQDSFRALINTLSPGAYVSLTKVDFKALDKLTVKPIGVYGSKEGIVSLLSYIGAVDAITAQALMSAKDNSPGPVLRSGLYLVRSFNATAVAEQIFAVYWPEDTTWNDDAISSVRRNRVTFMRYLTKIADQVISLISSEHAKSMPWNNHSEQLSMSVDDDQGGRLFTFEVAKTNEQEEDVTVRPGFMMASRNIVVSKPSEDCKLDLSRFIPTLLAGETAQAFMTVRYVPPTNDIQYFNKCFNGIQLRNLLTGFSVKLNESLSSEAISVLLEHGLQSRFPKPCGDLADRRARLRQLSDTFKQKQIYQMKDKMKTNRPQLERTLHGIMVDRIMETYPTLGRERLGPFLRADNEDKVQDLESEFEKSMQLKGEINSGDFKVLKERLISIANLFTEHRELKLGDRDELARLILEHGDLKGAIRLLTANSSVKSESWMSSWFTARGSSLRHSITAQAHQISSSTPDADFLSNLHDQVAEEPLLQGAAETIVDIANVYLDKFIEAQLKSLVSCAEKLQEREYKIQIERVVASKEAEFHQRSLMSLMQGIEIGEPALPHTLTVDSLEIVPRYRYHGSSATEYTVSGQKQIPTESTLEYKIHVLDLPAHDRQSLRLDPTFIPSPHVEGRLSHTFRLPVNYSILHVQLLENERLLLIVDDHCGNLSVYLERLSYIDVAVLHHSPRKSLHREKIGNDCVIAFDEGKRMLSVCASAKLQLHIFVFDETFKLLQSWGSVVNLASWYTEGTSICLSCFVCGSEEILLIDNTRDARIFSLITQQFRPATLCLEKIPTRAFSSPDGACLLLSYPCDPGMSLLAYHWNTFGSTEGITWDCPAVLADKLVVTSFVNRSSVHMLGLDIDHHLCTSIVLDITKKVTEFMFKEGGTKHTPNSNSNTTIHDCLVDCHADVWTRFPVVPAVQRQTILSCSGRLPKRLVFVTDRDHNKFASRFWDLVLSFEQRTRKPTGDELRKMTVVAIGFSTFIADIEADKDWKTSSFRLGEWLVDLLCLIPIHIAITRENRFIPLKDGVTSAELEKSLLGAQVGCIVDKLSFGWYESIFQSYMVSKPVKVVSSMGEQSVGKSFALNHLVDTSFAGSAMRTTEGVWMSVTPTENALIVALDFEGVHSIERSAQEDTLLVLFNTAISNLVLFRNNFALSRDITGLFQSFQSSSTVFDPAANPSLFQSRLAIIIKDVVDSDKSEIVREFSLKFQKIVQDEQDANFISRLHAGKLDIIPWPVIESRQFYTLFPALKKRLDQQPVTHATAGEFLLTLKTLMAKLKANDWGALSQTLAAHRAQQLLTMLQNALTFGFSEVDEPLKNIDSGITIDMPDTKLQFCLSESRAKERATMMAALQLSWDHFDRRVSTPDQIWFAELSSYLDNVTDMRINHVKHWIASNLSRFKTNHANIETLRRAFYTAIVDLKANVQLCKAQCTSCHLLCLHHRDHESEDPHDCQTGHYCPHLCSFGDEHPESEKKCGYPAGHSGKHICAVDIHLCGEPCKLLDKNGCSGGCTKVVGHEGTEHMCSASTHACGEPCQLMNVKSAGTQSYSCPSTCSISSDEEHHQHTCDNHMCPLPCQLCKRLCSNANHLHGLDAGAVHLCGQSHSCSALCAANGICEIDTAPQSIEATFTGRHETFQYTKYSQVAKRLPCIIAIPPAGTKHVGPHSHSTGEAPFHFCETRCESCGYFCTLPRGHPQREHETRHGSMSKTRFVVDGPDGTILKLNGRKFGAGDNGAPMMCSLYCSEMGRHVHLDYCRTDPGIPCQSAEVQHMSTRLQPDPDRPKDWVTHSLYWRRTGFKDPYSRDEQTNFAKCDAMCGGPEHAATTSNTAQPSYCTLPIFHASRTSNAGIGLGYVSNDGHFFSCKNPAVMQQAFHVIFVIDRSGSMGTTDRRPLVNVPGANTITRYNNNRLGAVYSSLNSFWLSRQAALNAAGQQAAAVRRDAYSVLLFDHAVTECLSNDFKSSPEALLAAVVQNQPRGGTDYTAALVSAQAVMRQKWSTERTPVVIFLSDGECSIADQTVQNLCRSAVTLGKPLSLHTVSFGPRSSTLRRMAQIALEVQSTAPRDPLVPITATVDSSYAEALDSVRLAETFLGIAESLRKPRGSLIH